MSFNYYYGTEAEQFAFFRIPRALIKDKRFKELSSDAKLLYGLMLDRMALSMKNGWFDSENRVFIYYTLKDIIEDLGCSRPTVAKIIAELDSKSGIGLIEKKRQGQGKPDIIYVKNFVGIEAEVETSEDMAVENQKKDFYKNCENRENIFVSEVQNSDFKKSKNLSSRSKEFESLEVKKFDPNYTNINKTEKNNNNHINQSQEKEIDVIDGYEQLIAENIQYDSWMLRNEKELVEELYRIICDAICVKRENIRVNGMNYPYEMVKAQLLKLNYGHIEYVLEMLRKTTSRINNIRAYLVTTLYNAVSSMNCYYQQEVQHDLYGNSA